MAAEPATEKQKAFLNTLASSRPESDIDTGSLSKSDASAKIDELKNAPSSATGSVSGSIALQFFACTIFGKCDADLYAPLAGYRAIGNFLINDGYQFVPDRHGATWDEAVAHSAVSPQYADNNFGRWQGMAAVFTFRKEVGHNGEEEGLEGEKKYLYSQVIVCICAPLEVIFNFYSSELLFCMPHSDAHDSSPI